MRILITGVQGQLGTELTLQLSRLGLEHIGCSRKELDISSEEQTVQLLRKYRPDAVINCAAYNAVDDAQKNSAIAFAVNRDGPAYLAATCADIGSVLVHFSTDYVFDGEGRQSYCENHPAHPLNTYGLSKLAGERAVLDSDATHLVLRVSWVFGRIGKSFVDNVLRWAAIGEIRVVDDQRSVPCDAVGLAMATIEATQKLIADPHLGGLYHFAMGATVSRHRYAEIIVEHASRLGIISSVPVVAVTSDAFDTAAQRPTNSSICGSKFSDQFKIDPGDWQDGLEAYLSSLVS
jgi:dTDP-4-dehydrorhamnose reductase